MEHRWSDNAGQSRNTLRIICLSATSLIQMPRMYLYIGVVVCVIARYWPLFYVGLYPLFSRAEECW
jgi:hypothetical protein